MADQDEDIFGMSDDDFAKLAPTATEGAKASSEIVNEAITEKTTDEAKGDVSDDKNSFSSGSNITDNDADNDDKSDNDKEDKSDKSVEDEKDISASKADDKSKAKTDENSSVTKPNENASDKVEAQAAVELKPEEYVAFYKEIMKPFKANGREITLKNTDEAIRLMQMGAGYGRKLQEMQPHLKTLRMLEKNNLLNENDLSYLIDLHQKNPDAIKKLIKDSGLDPLDINTEDNANYRPSNHTVSDNEIAFQEVLKDVSAQPNGQKTIQHINSTWDKESKEFLWHNPQVLSVIQSQRENGLYDQIATEVERQKTLGYIKPGVAFLEAYKIAGDALVKSNSLILNGSDNNNSNDLVNDALNNAQQNAKVIGIRTAAPKIVAPNNDKAKAAASPTTSPRKSKEVQNPLDMADDDFLKMMSKRL